MFRTNGSVGVDRISTNNRKDIIFSGFKGYFRWRIMRDPRKTIRQELRFKIATLDRKGYTQQEIAKKVGISQPMVCKYLKKIRDEYAKATILTHDGKIQDMISRKLMLVKEAYEAFERSGEDKVRIEEEETEFDEESAYNVGSKKKKVVREGRIPDERFLRLIRDVLKDISQLTGMATTEIAATPQERFDFLELAERLTRDDPLEIALKQLPSKETTERSDTQNESEM